MKPTVIPSESVPIFSGPTPDLTAIGAPAVWAQGYTGQGIVVGSADTGVSLQPDLALKYRGYTGPGQPTNDDYNWFDPSPISPCSSPCDVNGHGTHTTGTMVASNHFFQVGVAPGAKFIACRNLGTGASASTVLACLQWFLAPTRVNGQNPDPSKAPDVTNHSYFCNSCDLEDAFTALINAGIAVIVGTGNVGPRCRSVEEPAIYANVAGVGAMDGGFDNNPGDPNYGTLLPPFLPFNTIAFYSARGPTGANVTKPQFVAPGTNILGIDYLGGYVMMSGTSMATPHVTGAVALLWSARPELRGNVAATLSILAGTATRFVDTSCNNAIASNTGLPLPNILPYILTVPNNVYGYGFIHVDKALESKWPTGRPISPRSRQ